MGLPAYPAQRSPCHPLRAVVAGRRQCSHVSRVTTRSLRHIWAGDMRRPFLQYEQHQDQADPAEHEAYHCPANRADAGNAERRASTTQPRADKPSPKQDQSDIAGNQSGWRSFEMRGPGNVVLDVLKIIEKYWRADAALCAAPLSVDAAKLRQGLRLLSSA